MQVSNIPANTADRYGMTDTAKRQMTAIAAIRVIRERAASGYMTDAHADNLIAELRRVR